MYTFGNTFVSAIMNEELYPAVFYFTLHFVGCQRLARTHSLWDNSTFHLYRTDLRSHHMN